MKKIEDEAEKFFNQKVEEMKQRIIRDVNISDDNLVQAYEDGLGEVRKSVVKITNLKIEEVINKAKSSNK